MVSFGYSYHMSYLILPLFNIYVGLIYHTIFLASMFVHVDFVTLFEKLFSYSVSDSCLAQEIKNRGWHGFEVHRCEME